MSWKYLNRSRPSRERMYEIIRAPVTTEKSTLMSEHGQVVFKVASDASKPDIRAAVEALFKVKVVAVNTLRTHGKARRFRGRPGRCPGFKKAMVTLAAGQSIDVSAGL